MLCKGAPWPDPGKNLETIIIVGKKTRLLRRPAGHIEKGVSMRTANGGAATIARRGHGFDMFPGAVAWSPEEKTQQYVTTPSHTMPTSRFRGRTLPAFTKRDCKTFGPKKKKTSEALSLILRPPRLAARPTSNKRARSD